MLELKGLLERAKAQKARHRELKQHLKVMRTNETQLIEIVGDLKKRLNPPRNSVEIQTDSSGMIELSQLRDEAGMALQKSAQL